MSKTVICFLFLSLILWTKAYELDCPVIPPSDPVPTDVHKLRASDIKVVAGMGDSITAGFAMYDHFILDGLFEYRGDAFMIGGNEGQPTIPNFLKTVRGSPVIGGAIGKSLPLDAIKFRKKIIQPFYPEVDQLNAAQSEAKIDAVPGQIDYLVKQMHTYEDLDFEKDWKMLNIFIGANNICESCHPDRIDSTPDGFVAKYQLLLEKLYAEVPRAIVNIVPAFNVSQVYKIDEGDEYCMWVHSFFAECGCMFSKDSSDEWRVEMDKNTQLYNERLFALEQEWEDKHLTDFAVHVQPFIWKTVLDNEEYLSNLDCFHPSAETNKYLAIGLWNNMFTPKDKKSDAVDPDAVPMCPTETDFLM